MQSFTMPYHIPSLVATRKSGIKCVNTMRWDWVGQNLKTMTIVNRAKAPTPSLFKKIRNIGLTMAAASAIVLASPIPLPDVLIKAAGYISVAGGVASVVCQLTTGNNEKPTVQEPQPEHGQ